MRGARRGRCRGRVEVRLTPAGAGSTATCLRMSHSRAAYPRRCGEHVLDHRWDMVVGGLPPQVRGALGDGLDQSEVCGLTPAGAGSTWRWACSSAPWWAYPRRCGEHDTLRLRVERPVGLPPQVRGAPNHGLGDDPVTRLTPAGAGSTVCISLRVTLGQAYPRRCGEHPPGRPRPRRYGGLPPQVRGAPPGAS